VKLRKLKKHLREHQCFLKREGANHELWENAETNDRSTVPRHPEIPWGTTVAICKQLGIPRPEQKS